VSNEHVEIDIRFPPDKEVRLRYDRVMFGGVGEFFPREVRVVAKLSEILREADKDSAPDRKERKEESDATKGS
jgi:hypothetical protein